MAWSFRGALTVLPGSAAPETVAAVGASDLVLVWLDAAGGLRDVATFGMPGESVSARALPAADGGRVLAGHFTGPALRLGADTLEAPANPPGLGEAFVAALDRGFALRWGFAFGTIGEDRASGLAAAADGGWVVTGHFGQFVPAAPLAVSGLPDATLVGDEVGSGDAFALSVADGGQPQWLRGWSSPGADGADAVDAAPDGGVVVSGSAVGGVAFDDGGRLSASTPVALLVRYAADGHREWVETTGPAVGGSVVVFGDGAVVQTSGVFTGTVFGSGEATVDRAGSLDGAVALRRGR